MLHTSSHTMRCRSVGHLLHVIHCHTYILGENFYYIIIYNVMREGIHILIIQCLDWNGRDADTTDSTTPGSVEGNQELE